jgi:hypothetical protein
MNKKNILKIGFGLILLILCGYTFATNSVRAANGSTYYVSISGYDFNDGSIEKPWGTLSHAFSQLKAGDTLYVRSGTYTDIAESKYGIKLESPNSGTEDNRICVFAYPGEVPVLDFSNVTGAGMRWGFYMNGVNYWHFKGLHITKLSQPTTGNMSLACLVTDSNNNIFELMEFYGNKAAGFRIDGASEGNLILNCDAYDNYDPYTSSPGNNADGIQVASITYRAGNPRVNTLKGCRSWYNSDDGFDFWKNDGKVIVEDCWAFNNGRDKGDGCGFKLGKTIEPREEGIVKRVMRRCIASNNREWGYNNNAADLYAEFFNIISYDNDSRGFYLDIDVDMHVTIKNSISFKNTYPDRMGNYATTEHNNWDMSNVTVTDDDFLSVDHTLLETERQTDGSLPETDYLKLKKGSDLIDAGIDVGLPYIGSAPDIGVYEYDPTTGMSMNSIDNDFEIYPNPTDSGIINIKWSANLAGDKLDIDVYNLKGTLIAQNRVELSPGKIDLSGNDPGIYLLRLRDNSIYRSCKVVLNH